MQYRRLSLQLVRYLEATEESVRWPAYRALKTFSIRKGWAFAEREYSRLRRVHVGAAELVTSLISFHCQFHEEPLANAISTIRHLHRDKCLDHLSDICDGRDLRRNDYYRGVTWRELPLLMMLRSGDDEERSYCRSEAMASCIANAQYVEIAKSLVSLAEWRNLGLNSPGIVERVGDSIDEYVELILGFWRAIPECVWLVHSKKQLVGGSVVIPLTATAYESLRSGDANDHSLSPALDLRLSSRNLLILAMTDLPDRPKPRLPGVKTALQARKLLQHCAVLLGDESHTTEPVRVLVSVGSKKDEKAIERMGFTPLWRNLYGTNSPLYEIVIPAPEVTLADYSSAETTLATLVGTAWRLLRRD